MRSFWKSAATAAFILTVGTIAYGQTGKKQLLLFAQTVNSFISGGNWTMAGNYFFTGGVAQGYEGPCDILAAAHTPCVAAHSVTRKMFVNYSGYAFQLERASDSTTLNVGFGANNQVNQSAWTSFCAATQCYFSEIYDQAGNNNHLPGTGTLATLAPLATIQLPNGNSIPVINTGYREYYRNRTNTSLIPTGTQSITEYYVRNTQTVSGCCGDYGDVEATVSDNGAGHMFSLSYSFYNGQPPRFGVDRENGLQDYISSVPPTCGAFSLIGKYSNALNAMTFKVANVVTGSPYVLAYNVAPQVSPALEGGLSLGEGGDSSVSPTSFFEGAIIATATTDATDTQIQANTNAFYGGGAPIAGSYQGPGDVCPGAIAWFGLRAYSNAEANALANAIQVTRVSDNTTSNIPLTVTGALNIASALAFAGTDTTCSSATASSSTTITVSGCGATPHVGSTIAGTGVGLPVYITSVNVTAGAGTITVSKAQTLTAIAITMTYGLYISEFYDQTNNGNNVAQSTEANMPWLVPNCVAALPCAVFSGAQGLYSNGTSLPTYPQPLAWSAVAERTGNTSAINVIFGTYTGGNDCGFQFYSSPNEVSLFCGSTVPFSGVNDNALHALQFDAATGGAGTAFYNVDGTVGTYTSSIGTGGTTNSIGLGANPALYVRQYMTGYFAEGGLWGAIHSEGVQSAMCHNQYMYWGTVGAC